MVSLVVSQIHVENTAERNAYFIRLKSNGHTDNNDGGFEAIVIDIVLILNKELLRIIKDLVQVLHCFSNSSRTESLPLKINCKTVARKKFLPFVLSMMYKYCLH